MRSKQLRLLDSTIESIAKMQWLKNALNGVVSNLETPMGYQQIEAGIADLQHANLEEFMTSLSQVRTQLEAEGV